MGGPPGPRVCEGVGGRGEGDPGDAEAQLAADLARELPRRVTAFFAGDELCPRDEWRPIRELGTWDAVGSGSSELLSWGWFPPNTGLSQNRLTRDPRSMCGG